MTKVMIFGTFDILHKGHLNKFEQAKKYGDLIIIVARDDTVKKIKGKKPKYDEKQRQKNLRKYGKALLGYKTDKYKIIEKHKPDYIGLGYDQNSFTKDLKNELKARKLKTKIKRLKPYKAHKYKSSLLRNTK